MGLSEVLWPAGGNGREFKSEIKRLNSGKSNLAGFLSVPACFFFLNVWRVNVGTSS